MSDATIMYLLLAAIVVVFILDRLPVAVVAIGAAVSLWATGILTVDEAFSGFSNEIIIILASIFVLSGALMKGGVLDHLSDVIHRIAGGSRTKILLCVMPVTCFISSFMNNTTCTAVMMPAALAASRKSRVSPGKVLIPGVIDTCTNYVEHPEAVAQRIVRYAQAVGRENVIAGTDCGFGTMAGRSAVAPAVAYAKLGSLAEGARLASAILW